MSQNRETIINRIYYLAYKYRIRHMNFEWEGRSFDPTKPADQQFLEAAPLVVVSQILEKYLEAKDIIYKMDDSFIYRHHYHKSEPRYL